MIAQMIPKELKRVQIPLPAKQHDLLFSVTYSLDNNEKEVEKAYSVHKDVVNIKKKKNHSYYCVHINHTTGQPHGLSLSVWAEAQGDILAGCLYSSLCQHFYVAVSADFVCGQ